MPSATDKTRARFEKLLDRGKEIRAAEHEVIGIGCLDEAAYANWRVQAEAALETLGKGNVYLRNFRRAGNSARSETITIQIGVIEGALEAWEPFDEPAKPTNKGPTMAATKNGIFFSHASANKAITDDFVGSILEQGIGINPRDIFYSSSPDQGVPTGHDFINHIRSEIKKCSALVAWITPEYLKSSFCMCELGAAWALLPQGSFLPLVHGVPFSQLPPPFSGRIGLNMASASANTSLNTLHDDLTKLFGLTPHSLARWERNRDAFKKKHL